MFLYTFFDYYIDLFERLVYYIYKAVYTTYQEDGIMIKRISTMNIHYRYYSLEYFFASCVENKIDNIELWLCPHHINLSSELLVDRLDYINYLVENKDMNIVCVCPEQNNPKPNNIASKDQELSISSINYFKKVIDVAQYIGSDKILMTSGWAFYDEDFDDAWDRSLTNMREVASYAKKKQIKICIESLQKKESILVNSLSSMKRYLVELNHDNVYVALDLGALGSANETIEQWFEEFNDLIIHIHFVDGKPTGHLAIGDGNRCIEDDLSTINRFNYEGYLSFEFANSMYFEEPKLADNKSIQYIERI